MTAIDPLPSAVGRRLGRSLHIWWLAFARVLLCDLHRIRANAAERRAVPGSGAAHDQVVDYLAWRRGVLLCAGLALVAVFCVRMATTAVAPDRSPDWALLAIILPLLAVVVTAAAAASWHRLLWSRGLAVGALILLVGVPFATAVLAHPPAQGLSLRVALLAVLPAALRGVTTAKTAFPARAQAGPSIQATAAAAAATMALVVLWAAESQSPRVAVVCCLGLVAAPWLLGASAGPALGQPRMDAAHASHAVRRARALARPAWLVGIAGLLGVLAHDDNLRVAEGISAGLQGIAVFLLATCATADTTVRRLTREWTESADWIQSSAAADHQERLRALQQLEVREQQPQRPDL